MTTPERPRDLRSPGRRPRRVGRLALALVAAAGLAAPAGAQDDDDIQDTRTALSEWVETQRIISKERQDWEIGREVLNERIELVQREIDSLKGRIGEAQESIADADKKRQELIEENEALKTAASSLDETVIELERRTLALLERLPDPIRDRVKPLTQQIPEDPAETKLSLGQRFQNIVGTLNAVNKFNREITVTSEVRELSDGTKAEVTAMYVGIGQGYYVTANEDAAGVGKANAEAWVWEPVNASAPAIAQAIRILKNEEAATFVQLPIRID